MKRGLNVGLYQFVFSLSQSLDLINPAMANHHKRVAYIALRIAETAEITGKEKENIVIAAALHDIGALSFKRNFQEDAAAFRQRSLAFNLRSAHFGYQLIQRFKPFIEAARILRYHNMPWAWGSKQTTNNDEIPLGSHVVHLANLVDHMLDKKSPVLQQTAAIFSELQARSGEVLCPQFVKAFLEVSKSDAFWLDLDAPDLIHVLFERAPFSTVDLDIEGLLDFAELLAQIIDFRCRYTATHSHGVADAAALLAHHFGFPAKECKRLKVAGYLHDIGKLSIPMEMMEKPGKLTDEEWQIVRAHPYYTFRILAPIKGMEDIAHWCGLHHERLNGEGYPYRVSQTEIPLEARILAVADVFTALTENRPYRHGLDEVKTLAILEDMVKEFSLDANIVNVLKSNFEEINGSRAAAQAIALQEYKIFMDSIAILDLSGARTAHLAWKFRLRAYLDGENVLTREQLVNHHDCDLGRWFYGEGLQHYGDIPEMHSLEIPHAELHRLTHTLVHHYDHGEHDKAEACFTQLAPLSTQIVDILCVIESKAAEAMKSQIDAIHIPE